MRVAGEDSTSSTVPWAMMLPPSAPEPGPIWIGNTYLDGFDRISPAFLNSTGLM